jgi:hypothetical protein
MRKKNQVRPLSLVVTVLALTLLLVPFTNCGSGFSTLDSNTLSSEGGPNYFNDPGAPVEFDPGTLGSSVRTQRFEIQLPQRFVDPRPPKQVGRKLPVATSAELESALLSAVPGDTIVLQAGVDFVTRRPFRLPPKPCALAATDPQSCYVVIESSQVLALEPRKRVGPSQTRFMPRLVTSTDQAALLVEDGAKFWWIRGVAFGSSTPVGSGGGFSPTLGFVNNMVVVGQQSPDPGLQPQQIVFDRNLIIGRDDLHLKRGFEINAGAVGIFNSYVAKVHGIYQDAQAVGGWTGGGPYWIENNYLEAGQNLIFGGATQAAKLDALTPSDILIRRNFFFSPQSWNPNSAEYRPNPSGVPWLKKNIVQFKIARRVLMEQNILDGCWPPGQEGHAMNISTFQDAPSTDLRVNPQVTDNILIRHNLFRNAKSAFTLSSGTADSILKTNRVLIEQNLFFAGGGRRIGPGDTRLIVASGDIDRLGFRENSFFCDPGSCTNAGGVAFTVADRTNATGELELVRNIFHPGLYGFMASGPVGGFGESGIRNMVGPNAVVSMNAFVSNIPVDGQPNVLRFANFSAAGYVNGDANDFRWTANSPLRTDRIGVNAEGLNALLSGVE